MEHAKWLILLKLFWLCSPASYWQAVLAGSEARDRLAIRLTNLRATPPAVPAHSRSLESPGRGGPSLLLGPSSRCRTVQQPLSKRAPASPPASLSHPSPQLTLSQPMSPLLLLLLACLASCRARRVSSSAQAACLQGFQAAWAGAHAHRSAAAAAGSCLPASSRPLALTPCRQLHQAQSNPISALDAALQSSLETGPSSRPTGGSGGATIVGAQCISTGPANFAGEAEACGSCTGGKTHPARSGSALPRALALHACRLLPAQGRRQRRLLPCRLVVRPGQRLHPAHPARCVAAGSTRLPVPSVSSSLLSPRAHSSHHQASTCLPTSPPAGPPPGSQCVSQGPASYVSCCVRKGGERCLLRGCRLCLQGRLLTC